MLVPQNSPCPECGHARRDHELSLSAGGGELCKRCGCTATTIDTTPVFVDPSAPPGPFDWNFALGTFVMELESDEGLFTDTIDRWRPAYELAPGELEELRDVEMLVRELVRRYGPTKPRPASIGGLNVAEENAAVDEYQNASNNLKGVILRLAVTNEWQSYFPASEHAKINRARSIIIKHHGNTLYEQEKGRAV
jgi:hypothetical protein